MTLSEELTLEEAMGACHNTHCVAMIPLTIVPVTIVVMGTVVVCFKILMAQHFVWKTNRHQESPPKDTTTNPSNSNQM
jgi:hypothetical protein